MAATPSGGNHVGFHVIFPDSPFSRSSWVYFWFPLAVDPKNGACHTNDPPTVREVKEFPGSLLGKPVRSDRCELDPIRGPSRSTVGDVDRKHWKHRPPWLWQVAWLVCR